MILPTTRDYFEAIARIDAEGFGRNEPRSHLNLQSLVDTSEGLAFTYLHQREPAGYIFSRRLGETAYIGPLGVRADVQDKGVGRMLMLASMDGLRTRSQIIGLEVRPHNVKAIGLYARLGFVNTYPSLNFPVPGCSELDRLVERDGTGTTRLVEFEDIVATRNAGAVHDIARFTFEEFGDIDFSMDLAWALGEGNGWVIVARGPGGKVSGFMALVPELLDMVWGAVSEHSGYGAAAMLLRELRRRAPERKMLLRVNARYVPLCSFLASSGFRLSGVTSRMLLEGFQGDSLLPSNKLMLRAWIG
ncbi:MAG: N-acetyltransferase [Bacillota bacterium]|nr:N-acetyltransferase [Bacillota bacterium]